MYHLHLIHSITVYVHMLYSITICVHVLSFTSGSMLDLPMSGNLF